MKIQLNEQTALNWKDFKEEGMRIEIFGISGSGKSHAIKVLIEEFLHNAIPFVAIDPEGEYASFKEVTDCVVLGGKFGDLPLDQIIFKDVLSLLLNKVNVVFDLSEVIHLEERSRIATTIQEQVFQFASQQKRLFVYVVDEARLIAPQQGKSKANQIAADIAQRGRKRGIIPIFGMQRPSEVDKSVLTQCNIHLMGKLQFPTDVKYIKDFLRDAQITEAEIKQLEQEFYLWTGAKGQKIKFREKTVKDLGRTIQPGEEIQLEVTTNVDLTQSIQELQKALEHRKQEEAEHKSELEQLKEQLEHIETEKGLLEQELKHEQEAVRVAKKLTFDVEGLDISSSQNHVLETMQGQINDLQQALQDAQKKQFVVKVDDHLKEIPRDVAKTIAFDEEYILTVDVWGIDIRDGKVLCDETAFLLLNQMTYEERALYFEMVNQDPKQDGFSWTRLVDLISGKGPKTIRPILTKLIRLGLVRTRQKRGHTNYIAQPVDMLKQKLIV